MLTFLVPSSSWCISQNQAAQCHSGKGSPTLLESHQGWRRGHPGWTPDHEPLVQVLLHICVTLVTPQRITKPPLSEHAGFVCFYRQPACPGHLLGRRQAQLGKGALGTLLGQPSIGGNWPAPISWPLDTPKPACVPSGVQVHLPPSGCPQVRPTVCTLGSMAWKPGTEQVDRNPPRVLGSEGSQRRALGWAAYGSKPSVPDWSQLRAWPTELSQNHMLSKPGRAPQRPAGAVGKEEKFPLLPEPQGACPWAPSPCRNAGALTWPHPPEDSSPWEVGHRGQPRK